MQATAKLNPIAGRAHQSEATGRQLDLASAQLERRRTLLMNADEAVQPATCKLDAARDAVLEPDARLFQLQSAAKHTSSPEEVGDGRVAKNLSPAVKEVIQSFRTGPRRKAERVVSPIAVEELVENSKHKLSNATTEDELDAVSETSSPSASVHRLEGGGEPRRSLQSACNQS